MAPVPKTVEVEFVLSARSDPPITVTVTINFLSEAEAASPSNPGYDPYVTVAAFGPGGPVFVPAKTVTTWAQEGETEEHTLG